MIYFFFMTFIVCTLLDSRHQIRVENKLDEILKQITKKKQNDKPTN